jgi:hypothetical protein
MSDDLEDDLDADPSIEDEPLSVEQVRHYVIAGLAVSDMAKLLRVEVRKVQEAIAACKPTGKRRGVAIFAVADVAPLVLKPQIDIESYIRSLKPKDLPPALQKAFWDAQEARQSFEEKAGNLWHTHRVLEVIGKFVMIVRQRVVLAVDQVDRMTPLTDEQRKLVQGLLDGMLAELQKGVAEAFKDYTGKGERQDIYEDGPPKPFKVDDTDDGLGDGL